MDRRKKKRTLITGLSEHRSRVQRDEEVKQRLRKRPLDTGQREFLIVGTAESEGTFACDFNVPGFEPKCPGTGKGSARYLNLYLATVTGSHLEAFLDGGHQTYLGLVGKSGIKTRPKAAQTTVIKPSTICPCQPLPRSVGVLVRRDGGTRQMRMTYKHPAPTGQAVRVVHGLLDRTLEGTRQHQADW